MSRWKPPALYPVSVRESGVQRELLWAIPSPVVLIGLFDDVPLEDRLVCWVPEVFLCMPGDLVRTAGNQPLSFRTLHLSPPLSQQGTQISNMSTHSSNGEGGSFQSWGHTPSRCDFPRTLLLRACPTQGERTKTPPHLLIGKVLENLWSSLIRRLGDLERGFQAEGSRVRLERA